MTQNRSSPEIRLDRHYPSPLGGFLSYLIPGLGQVYQGRIAKGIMFFLCLYALFFYGMYLGQWQNVYIYAPSRQERQQRGGGREWPITMLADRARFIAQAWIGIAAWPAVWQHWTYDPNVDKHPLLGKFERRPSEFEMNEMLRNSDKSPDLGWVYTVIAGVLNILVIYDAYAGPVFFPRPRTTSEEESKEEASA